MLFWLQQNGCNSLLLHGETNYLKLQGSWIFLQIEAKLWCQVVLRAPAVAKDKDLILMQPYDTKLLAFSAPFCYVDDQCVFTETSRKCLSTRPILWLWVPLNCYISLWLFAFAVTLVFNDTSFNRWYVMKLFWQSFFFLTFFKPSLLGRNPITYWYI